MVFTITQIVNLSVEISGEGQMGCDRVSGLVLRDSLSN